MHDYHLKVLYSVAVLVFADPLFIWPSICPDALEMASRSAIRAWGKTVKSMSFDCLKHDLLMLSKEPCQSVLESLVIRQQLKTVNQQVVLFCECVG